MRRLYSVPAFAAFFLAACGDTAQDAGPAPAAATEVSSVSTPLPVPEPGLEFADLPPPYNSASYSAGRRTWKLCQSCHLTAEGAGHLVGPNLHGLFERRVAAAPGFEYSPALKAETFNWTPEQLDQWLASPRGFVPGNRMSFAGVRKPEDRVAVIAFLMLETDYSAPDENATEAP